MADIEALCSICASATRRSSLATLRAGNTNSGKAAIARSVSRHSACSMTMRMNTTVIRLEMIVMKVPVTACCAPTTSLLIREMSSPVLVAVKNRRDIRWR